MQIELKIKLQAQPGATNKKGSQRGEGEKEGGDVQRSLDEKKQ